MLAIVGTLAGCGTVPLYAPAESPASAPVRTPPAAAPEGALTQHLGARAMG
ncbi:MAG: hypothetical protein ACOVOD_17780 [Rhodoferax sp.]